MLKIIIKKKIVDLQERESDTLYGKITNFFDDFISDKKKLDYSIGKIKEGDLATPVIKVLINDTVLNIQEEYKKYVESTGDTKIISTPELFHQILLELKILFCPKWINPGAGGDMSPNGEMRIFIDWNIPKMDADMLDMIDGGGTYMSDSTIKQFFPEAFEKLEEIKNSDLVSKINFRIFYHEFVHYINSIRSGLKGKDRSRKSYRARGGKKQFDIRTFEYARSTEEWQARLGEIFSRLQKIINTKLPASYDVEQDVKTLSPWELETKYLKALRDNEKGYEYEDLFWSLVNGSFSSFYEAFKKIPDVSMWTTKLNTAANNRLKKRIYSSYFDLRKNLLSSKLGKIATVLSNTEKI